MLTWILAGVACGLAYTFYRFFAALLSPQSGKNGQPSAGRNKENSAEEEKRRAAALAQFSQNHAAARDARKQVAQAVNEDPQRAAQVLSKIMKH